MSLAFCFCLGIALDGLGSVLLLCFSLTLNAVLIAALLKRDPNGKVFKGSSECPKCGYDTRVTAGGRCPECGEPVTQRSLPPGMIVRCSFCGVSHRETGVQVEGPGGVYICAACVDLAADLVADERKKGLMLPRNTERTV